MTSSRIAPLLIAGFALTGALTGCAHPVPSPNPAAEAVQAPADTPLATKPTIGQALGAVAANKVEILFAPGKASLSHAADQNLDVAARLFRDANPVLMFVSGHADSTGSEFANLILSAHRAQSVKEGLVARGIPADRLLLQAFGQSDPATTDSTQAGDDRRVIVTWRLL